MYTWHISHTHCLPPCLPLCDFLLPSLKTPHCYICIVYIHHHHIIWGLEWRWGVVSYGWDQHGWFVTVSQTPVEVRFALRIWPGTIRVSRSRWMPLLIQSFNIYVACSSKWVAFNNNHNNNMLCIIIIIIIIYLDRRMPGLFGRRTLTLTDTWIALGLVLLGFAYLTRAMYRASCTLYRAVRGVDLSRYRGTRCLPERVPR